ncbi:MAG: hypothetical protein WAM97_22550 [Acidimicrobiales bacterium]
MPGRFAKTLPLALAILLPVALLSHGTTLNPQTKKINHPITHARLTSSQANGVPAYWVDAANGGVFAYGGAGFYGSAGNLHLQKPIVGMAATPNGGGYWLVASDGGVFAYGNAEFYGSMGGKHLNEPIVGMAPTPNGGGYWLVASDGGIFSFGDAGFYGSMGGKHLSKPVVGMAATPTGGGYWLVASDGGIFTFGNAAFAGSMGGSRLAKPIVAMAPTSDGQGYWMVGSDGGIFSFGDADFEGSMGGVTLASPVTGMAATPDSGGYWFTSANGTVFAFGDANYFGSATDSIANVVGISEGIGSGYAAHDSTFPQGAYGNDISNWQCPNDFPTEGHNIGIVQVNGWSFGSVNPCLSSEATWAGSGLELYIFLSYGTQATGSSECEGNQACNYGFAAAQDAFSEAQNAGVDTDVTWWLDIEESDNNWSSNAADNAQVIQGAILGLQAEAIVNVGIYSNISEWSEVTGGSGYSPYVPEWVAEWGSNDPPFNPEQYCSGWTFASGPTWIVQYTNGATTDNFDSDYAC